LEITPFVRWCREAAPFVGLFGDGATFAGGLVLALDALHKEREIKDIRRIVSTLKSPVIARLKVEMEGVILTDEDDVQIAFLRRSARKALLGCALLTVGFLALLLARGSEFLK